MWQTFWSTAISSLLGLGLGLGAGFWMFRYPRSRVQILMAIPYGIPTVVVGTAWIYWLGRSGVLAHWGWAPDWIYSVKSVILAHVFLETPWVGLLVSQAMVSIPRGQLEIAKTLGAGRFSEVVLVIWPYIRWAFASAVVQVSTLCVMSFALVLILGGGPPVQTLETELFQRLRYGYMDLSGALICGVWQLMLTLPAWMLVIYFQSKQKRTLLAEKTVTFFDPILKEAPDLRRKEWGLLMLLGSFLILPYFVVLGKPLIHTLFNSSLRSQILAPLKLSLVLAFLSAFFSILSASAAVLSMRFCAQSIWVRNFLGFAIGLPSGISVLVLSLGAWLAYGQWIDPLEGSFVGMVILQAVLFFPVAFRILWPVSLGIQHSSLDAATLLGASPLQAFYWVEWPRWKAPVLSAFAAVSGASLGEIGAVSFFSSENLIPLPLMISRFMQTYHFDEAQGVAGFLFLLSIALVVFSLSLTHQSIHAGGAPQ